MEIDERRRRLTVALELRHPALEASALGGLTAGQLEAFAEADGLLVMAKGERPLHQGPGPVYRLTTCSTAYGVESRLCYPSLDEAKERGQRLVELGRAEHYDVTEVSLDDPSGQIVYSGLEERDRQAAAERERRAAEERVLEALVRLPLAQSPPARPSGLAER